MLEQGLLLSFRFSGRVCRCRAVVRGRCALLLYHRTIYLFRTEMLLQAVLSGLCRGTLSNQTYLCLLRKRGGRAAGLQRSQLSASGGFEMVIRPSPVPTTSSTSWHHSGRNFAFHCL